MAFELYAHVAVPRFTLDSNGNPLHAYPIPEHRRVFVATYATKLLAQWWGINIKRVYIDPAKTILATERVILLYEIVEVP